MAERNNFVQDHDLICLLTIGIPIAIEAAIIFHVRGPRFDMWALTGYTAFLGFYLCWIAGYEYIFFDGLHRLKSRPVDSLLLAGAFAAVLQASRLARSAFESLLWIGLFCMGLVVWEGYTMMCGYDRYFKMRSYGAHFAILDIVRPADTEDGNWGLNQHWEEYRYWIISDGAITLGIGVACGLRTELLKVLSGHEIRLAISAIGFAIGLFNTYRYAKVARRVRALNGPDNQS